jgi:hypothetical protein
MADTDAPMLFSAFQYNVGFWPPALLRRIGNLVFFRSKCLSNMLEQSSNTNVRSHIDHEFGGHFAGLDNPPALVEDLREIGNYWKIKS